MLKDNERTDDWAEALTSGLIIRPQASLLTLICSKQSAEVIVIIAINDNTTSGGGPSPSRSANIYLLYIIPWQTGL